MSKSDVTLVEKNSFNQFKKKSDTIPVGNIIFQYKEETLSVLYFNEMMCQIVGYSRDECNSMLEDNPWELIYPDDLEELQPLFYDLLMYENQVDYNCRIKSNEETRHVTVSAKIIEKNEECLLINCVFADTTDIADFLKIGVNNTSLNIDYKEIEYATTDQIDQVTGVYNRDTFKEKSLVKMKLSNEDLVNCFVIVGVNNFSKVNDEFGYSYGDKVLKSIAKSISHTIDEDDIIGRLSGTKFLIYMYNNPDIEMVKHKLELISMAVNREAKDSVKISFHMGVALYRSDGNTYNELFEKASIALSQGKGLGNNKYVFYSDVLEKHNYSSLPSKQTNISEEREIDIRTFGYFDIFLDGQAILIVNAKAKELLALLVHRRGGFVTPGEIIAHLWEDEEANQLTMARCRKTFMLLRDTLRKYGMEDILESNKGVRRIRPEKVNCDLYNYLSGNYTPDDLFKGLYMLNYSWGELYMAELQDQGGRLESWAD